MTSSTHEGAFEELQTRGFVVMPSFLEPAAVRALADAYQAQASSDNSNYQAKPIPPAVLAGIGDRFDWIERQVSQHTDIKIAAKTKHGIYFDTAKISFRWHQDHESYFIFQNHYNYLNCYMPVIKPVRDKSNVSIVPMDAIERRSPKLFDRIRGKGAAGFLPFKRFTVVTDENNGGFHGVLPYDLNEIGETPQLAPGDLLLMRGDMIHKTQDTDTKRVSASVRLTNPDGVTDLHHLARGGLTKMRMMVRNPKLYRSVFDAFGSAGTERMSSIDLMKSLGVKMKTAQPRPSSVSLLLDCMRVRLAARNGSMPRFG
jgi:hypothetical protein